MLSGGAQKAYTANPGVPGLVYITDNSVETQTSKRVPSGISGMQEFTHFSP